MRTFPSFSSMRLREATSSLSTRRSFALSRFLSILARCVRISVRYSSWNATISVGGTTVLYFFFSALWPSVARNSSALLSPASAKSRTLFRSHIHRVLFLCPVKQRREAREKLRQLRSVPRPAQHAWWEKSRDNTGALLRWRPSSMLGRHADFDDEWEEMPIEHVDTELEESESEEGAYRPLSPTKRAAKGARALAARRTHRQTSHAYGGTTNHAGQHLDVHDVRGYDWRTRPEDESIEKPGDAEGYTQLRLDEDEEEEELHAATEYLFQEDMNRIGDAGEDPSAAPISQLAMTKRLLTETQKIAYVGLCCITAHDLVREVQRLEPNEPKPASKSTSEWLLRVMVRLYQHLDIDVTGTCRISHRTSND